MQKWEYLQLTFGGVVTWIDSAGRQGRFDRLRSEVAYQDFEGREKKWLMHEPDYASLLNRLGDEGWELTGHIGGDARILVFKRPKQ